MKALVFAASASALALAACSPATETAPAEPAVVEAEVVEPVAEEEPVMAEATIVDIAVGNPDFSTLVAAVEAAGLAETLAGPGPYTVFAPTNAAFAALPAGTLDELLLPEGKDDLVRILSYHVVPGTVMSTDLPAEADGTAVASINNLDLAPRISADGAPMVNEAQITQADITASNGVIHVIDTVLMPRMEE
ncbi:MAG: fasciclin domain-containing protein [Hyphomonas sp.]